MDSASIEKRLVDLLLSQHMTVATAESCTGGLIAKRLTDVPGSSGAFIGSCVTYATAMKIKLLKVSRETVRTKTVVSPECAEQMALGVRKLMGADFAVSTTGYAGPGGGTAKNPVGTVYIGIATPYRSFSFRFNDSADASREEIRDRAATRAMQRLYREITGEEI